MNAAGHSDADTGTAQRTPRPELRGCLVWAAGWALVLAGSMFVEAASPEPVVHLGWVPLRNPLWQLSSTLQGPVALIVLLSEAMAQRSLVRAGLRATLVVVVAEALGVLVSEPLTSGLTAMERASAALAFLAKVAFATAIGRRLYLICTTRFSRAGPTSR